MSKWVDVENTNEFKGISTVELRRMLFDFITIAIVYDPDEEEEKEVGGEPPMDGLTRHTNYAMLWTSEEILSLFSAKVTNEPLDSLFPLPPSSTMIIEFYESEDESGYLEKYVRAYLNDQAIPLRDCVSNPCKIGDFLE